MTTIRDADALCYHSPSRCHAPDTQQTFRNAFDRPIDVSIEPWPECFELEPGDRLTLIYDAAEGDTLQVDFLNEHELVVTAHAGIDDIRILFNGGSAEGRSWRFRHR